MPLIKKRLSTLAILERKVSPEKWLKGITTTARGGKPVTYESEPRVAFPWAQLRMHTDAFLRKRDLTEVERDSLLGSLIAASPDKIVAIAACSHRLSSKAIFEHLATFQSDSSRVGLFLQAVVAASHDNAPIFPATDEQWARVLVQALDQSTDRNAPPVSAIQLLVHQWSSSPLPTYNYLQDCVKSITTNFFLLVNASLEACASNKDWVKAREASACLTEIRSRWDRLPRGLRDIIEWELLTWRHWAAWEPEPLKLSLWQPYSDSLPVKPFWAGLGPDLELGRSVIHPTAMARVTGGGQLIHWMEASGLKPGFDIMVCESTEVFSFYTRLTAVLSSSCKLGGMAHLFLQYIATSDVGLDEYSLQLWDEARRSLIETCPQLLDSLLSLSPKQDGVVRSLNNETLVIGLSSLSASGASNLRTFLLPKIKDLLIERAEAHALRFMEDVGTSLHWLKSAEQVLDFRALLRKISWLHGVDLGWDVGAQAACSRISLENLQQLHLDVCDETRGDNSYIRGYLEDAFATYIMQIVLYSVEVQGERSQMIADLHKMWNDRLLIRHRALALQLLALRNLSAASRMRMISGIGMLPVKQVQKLEACLAENPKSDLVQVSYRILRIAARIVRAYTPSDDAWGALVLHVMGSDALLPPDDETFTNVSFKKYRNWVKNYALVFGSHKCAAQSLVWVNTLAVYSGEVDGIRAMEGSAKATHCLYTASSEPATTQILKMLSALKKNRSEQRDDLMRHCILSLGDNHKHAEAVSAAVISLANISTKGFELCQKLTIVAAQESVDIAAVQKDVWLGLEPDLETKKSLTHLAAALRLPAASNPQVAKDYFSKRIALVKKEAQAVEDMRLKLARQNRKGVTSILTSLAIESQSSALEEEILDLPSDLMSVIEQVDENTVEMHFSLINMSFTQRKAWGLSNSETITIRLVIGDNGSREAFCAHIVDPHSHQSPLKHDPLQHSKTVTPPDGLRCEGRVTRLTYMIMRGMWHWLIKNDGIPLTDLYKKIEQVVKSGRHNCVVCNQSHPMAVKTYRPSVCTRSTCRTTWLKSDRGIRLVDLRLDESVVELLLAAVHAAASTISAGQYGTNAKELLPGRPPRLSDAGKLLTLLDTIPKISTTFTTLASLYSIQSKLSINAELVLSWTTNNFRGFLMTAPPALQIPNMPGAKQFVLADSPPEIVAAFSQHDALQPRQVLFHGTSMDRLYAILCQGLKILSHTSLQTHGAAYGSGIYLAEDPDTAVSYSNISLCANSTFTSNHPTHINQKVLLGIEYAGNDASTGGGIHVAPDATKVLLRYVFLLPAGFRAPLAAHIVPAMQSNFHTLKSGARAT